jgi:hypothetical protein
MGYNPWPLLVFHTSFERGGAKNSQKCCGKNMGATSIKERNGVKWKILPLSSGILWNNSITRSSWKVRSPYHPT